MVAELPKKNTPAPAMQGGRHGFLIHAASNNKKGRSESCALLFARRR
jgi:hypothetical protein